MLHGTPDWVPLATGPNAELPTYRFADPLHVNAGAGNLYLASFFNPANSGELVKLRRFRLLVSCPTPTDAYDSFTFVLYRTTTAGTPSSNGSVQKHSLNDANSVVTIGLNLTIAPGLNGIIGAALVNLERRASLQPSRSGIHTFVFDLYEHPAASQLKSIEFLPGSGFALLLQSTAFESYVLPDAEWTEEIA